MNNTCELCAFNNPKATVTGIIVKDGKVLTLKRIEEPFKGKFDFPGGYMNAGETPEEAIKREIKEELGVDCETTFVRWFPGTASWKGKKYAILSHAFLVEAKGDLKLNKKENGAMKFIEISKLKSIAFDSNGDIADFVKKNFSVDYKKLLKLINQLDPSAKVSEINLYKSVLDGYISKKIVNGKLVGVGWVFPRRTFLRKQAVIEDVVVDIKERGKGYGKDITLDLMRWAKETGIEVIELTSGSHRVPANELYKKVGFKLHPTNHYLYFVDKK